MLELDEPEAVCETIALAIGLNECVIDLDEGVAHLTEMCAPGASVSAARTAVAKLPVMTSLVKSVVALPSPVVGKGSTGREYQAIRL